MNRYLFLPFIFLVSAVCLTAQQPSPTKEPVDDQVVKINTNLIQIDVTVLDKNGKVVTNLKPEDFELYENGERQTITSFGFVSKVSSGAVAGDGQAATRQAGNSSDQLKRGDVRRTISLVVDDLNLSFASVYYTRKALMKFVDEQMLPGDLVAVIRTGGGVGTLQQFTSNKELLRAAIAKIRWNPFSSLDALTSVGQTDTEISERFRVESDQVASGNSKQYTLLHPHDNVDEVQQASRNSAKNAADAQKALYAQSSIGTLKFIVSGMARLPGRKAMMVFSDGFNIGDVMNNKSRAPAIYDFIQDLTDQANKSSVTIYTFDPRGMQAMDIAASDNTYEVIDGHREQKVAVRAKDFRESQDGLVYIADRTGGKALINSNDLSGGIERALEEQNGYYLLGYVPDADSFDAGKRKFNKFEIKLRRPGLSVSYRSGFFSSSAKSEADAEIDADKQIAASLMSPFAESAIALNVNALYANDPTTGGYVRSFLHIDARDLAFSDTADGWKTSTFDVAAVAFGNNGVPVDHIHTTYTVKSKGATYDAMLQNGFVYVLMLPIKKAGMYQYRVALRDAASGKIGTASQVIAVPDLSKQKLTMSSMAVEDVSIPTWQLITQGKIGNGTGQTQLRSTLLYDTVLRQFAPNTVLRYGFEVYNASVGGRSVHLESQANILQNDKTIVRGEPIKYDSSDGSVPRISGAVTLTDKIQPGEYILEVTVRDPASKRETKQVFPFQIVK
jgi:VWFA-related protein